jgi:predicted DsbA family dithiol-disulfide isomerase
LKRYAQEIGLDSREFNTCLDSGKHTAEVEADRQIGIEVGVRGTPTFFFNGTIVQGSVPRDFLFDILSRFRNAQKDLNVLSETR